ncbi:MAG: magnesium transporter, partial [Christensenellaceae bacterium]
KTGVFETYTQRIPWLMLLMISATLTSRILNSFEDALAAQSALISFIPMISGTGGNAGSQSSVSVIRSLSLGELALRDILKVIWKEMRVSVVCGLSLAIVNFGKMLLIDPVTPMIAAVVCITLVFTVIVAKFVGCVLPLLVKTVGLDPAVMASPVITTCVDALSMLVYFQVAKVILNL